MRKFKKSLSSGSPLTSLNGILTNWRKYHAYAKRSHEQKNVYDACITCSWRRMNVSELYK